MKRHLIILSLIFLTLTSCVKEEHHNSSYSFEENSNLIFTEFLIGNFSSDRAIEISNIGANPIDLASYSVNIFKQNQIEPYIKIDLPTKNIEPGKSLVIAYDKANENILKHADIVTEKLMIDGTWPVALMHNDSIVDTLGYIGYQTNYGKQCDLVRKPEHYKGKKEIDDYDWMKFKCTNFENLGKINELPSDEILLEGPRLTEEILALPFIDEDGMGGGGVVEVTLSGVGDGDTSYFDFPSSLSKYGISNESVRYLKINTPEIQHGTSIDAQPWGQEAKKYNNNVLRNAKRFMIQTERNNTYRETYGRMLCYVWYSNLDNPKISDYVCLNAEMLTKGLAFTYFFDENVGANPVDYQGITYTNYFLNCELYAKKLGIKVHGEKDPNFI